MPRATTQAINQLFENYQIYDFMYKKRIQLHNSPDFSEAPDYLIKFVHHYFRCDHYQNIQEKVSSQMSNYGINCYSTFYRQFLKHVGVNPLEFCQIMTVLKIIEYCRTKNLERLSQEWMATNLGFKSKSGLYDFTNRHFGCCMRQVYYRVRSLRLENQPE